MIPKYPNLTELTTGQVTATYGVPGPTLKNWRHQNGLGYRRKQLGKRTGCVFRAVDIAFFLISGKAGKYSKAPEMVPLSELVLDEDIPNRGCVYDETVEHYAYLNQQGVALPPILVARLGGRLVVLDGVHRIRAAEDTNATHIETHILEGLAYDDAFAIALHANRKNGRQLSVKDKRAMVSQALRNPAYAQMGTRPLGVILEVSHNLVATVRREMHSPPEDAPAKASTAPPVAQVVKKVRRNLQNLATTYPAQVAQIEAILTEIENDSK